MGTEIGNHPASQIPNATFLAQNNTIQGNFNPKGRTFMARCQTAITACILNGGYQNCNEENNRNGTVFLQNDSVERMDILNKWAKILRKTIFVSLTVLAVAILLWAGEICVSK